MLRIFYRILMRMSKGGDFIGYRPKSHSPSVPGFKILSFYSRASMYFLSQIHYTGFTTNTNSWCGKNLLF